MFTSLAVTIFIYAAKLANLDDMYKSLLAVYIIIGMQNRADMGKVLFTNY